MAYTPKNPNGQATMANSSPVAISSDQSAVPVAPSTFSPSSNTSMHSAATATGNGNILPVSEYGTAVIQVTGTFVGTIAFEGTLDGSNWHAISATQIGSGTIATTATTTGIYRLSVSGLASVRARISSYTSGSITAIGRTTNSPFGTKVVSMSSGSNVVGSIASINTSVTPGTAAANLGKAEDAAHASGDVGVMALGVRASTPTDRSAGATDGDYEPFGVNEVGALWVTQTPNTRGGLSTYHLVSAASTNANIVKNSPAQIYGWFIYNNNASARKVAFHNTASSPTAGLAVYMSLVIPPNSGANVSFPSGIAFSAGIAITTVTGIADSDNTAVGANDLNINIFYK